MNHDLIANDQYHPMGALEINLRVREYEHQLAIQSASDRLVEATLQRKLNLLPFIRNLLTSLAG